MAFKEANLVFTVHIRGIGRTPHDAEMVPTLSCGDCSGGLRDELDAPHGLSVPVSGAVEGEFSALGAAAVGGVLVGG